MEEMKTVLHVEQVFVNRRDYSTLLYVVIVAM